MRPLRAFSCVTHKNGVFASGVLAKAQKRGKSERFLANPKKMPLCVRVSAFAEMDSYCVRFFYCRSALRAFCEMALLLALRNVWCA